MSNKNNKKGNRKRKDKSVKIFIYMLLFLLGILALIFSIKYFYKPVDKTHSYSYNNFVFTNISGLWYTEIQKYGTNKTYIIPLHYGPLELEYIPVSDEVDNFKNLTEIYITFRPDKEPLGYIALAAAELSINLAQTLNITPIAACASNTTEACAHRPIINCESPGKAAIFLNYDNDTRVYVKNNCIFVEGFEKEIVKATDRLLLKWFNVMK
ncbi:MAG: hypothetical protein QXG86_02340 [Candidatus Woesearchaeota archaeon]